VAHVPTQPGTLAPAASFYSQRPVYGRQPAGLANDALHQLGFVALRRVCLPLELRQAQHDRSDTASIVTSWDVRWTASPAARFVFVEGWYTNTEAVLSSATPAITVQVSRATGALVDAGVTWSWANGLLVATPEIAGTSGAFNFTDSRFTTGWTEDSRAPGLPRLLDIDGHQGRDLVAQFTFTDVRVYSLTLVEAVRREIP